MNNADCTNTDKRPILKKGMKGSAVSEMTLVLGSLIAALIIVVAAWQLMEYQSSELEAARTAQIARDYAKNINFVQQINSEYVLEYKVEHRADVRILDGYIEVAREGQVSTFPYLGTAEKTEIENYFGQTVCFENSPGPSGNVKVYLC